MSRNRLLAIIGTLSILAFLIAPACQVPSESPAGGSLGGTSLGSPGPAEFGLNPVRRSHRATVMTSAFCAKCHPAMYAEHQQNTHGRAFTDHEPRLATGRFAHSDCINCHTPRPIFETGAGMNPLRRHHNLEDGNSCMTCHWRPDFDYAEFQGGSECKTAFHPEVGSVDACSTCHRNHGTPYQWEKSRFGKTGEKTCMSCHMKMVRRPVAVGEPPRRVRSHVFPGSRSEKQLRRAYDYEARVEGDEVVIKITNSGAGHNFPTELKQRALESLVIIKDPAGEELYRSRMIFRDPYKRPYGLRLPVNTQIPAGESREHRVPIKVASGTAHTELHFKLYYPIEDHHPDLARQLELRNLPFAGVTPSTKTVETSPAVKGFRPEGTTDRQASAANYVDFANPPIAATPIQVPAGRSETDIKRLIELFMFPVPQAQTEARRALFDIGPPAVPALIEALGSWDNKTWKNAYQVLFKLGKSIRPSLLAAATSDQLYIRNFSRQILADLGRPIDPRRVGEVLQTGLLMASVIDRTSAADALGRLKIEASIPRLRVLLGDVAPDVVRSAALALAEIGDKDSVPLIRLAMARADFVETRRDLAKALAMLGCADGVPLLIQGLDHRDDLIREHFFEALFAVTGVHKSYDPLAPRPQRLEAIARIASWWAENGSGERLLRPWPPSKRAHGVAWGRVKKLGVEPNDESRDGRLIQELVDMGDEAVPAMILGLKYPAGFWRKRYYLLQGLGALRRKRSAPFVAAALRDPVVVVASRACQALGQIGDPDTLAAMQYYHSDLRSRRAAGTLPDSAGHADALIARSAQTRLRLGDETAKIELINFLRSENRDARAAANQALTEKYGSGIEYDPDGDATSWDVAAQKWMAIEQER